MTEDFRVVAMKISMALLKEQNAHPSKCIHCNYLQSGLEKEDEILVKHDTMCPVVAAAQFVESFNRQLVTIEA